MGRKIRLNARVQALQRRGQPVIAVDAKQKARLGDFQNAGRAWHPTGHPPEVRVDDFVDEALGTAIPYGVYAIGANLGWVSVGVAHGARRVRSCDAPGVVAPDGGGHVSAGQGAAHHGSEWRQQRARARLGKAERQRLADETGLCVAGRHLPPGTSQWNKSEHRMVCHITANWRGQPLLSREVIVSLIGGPLSTGLRIQAALDAGQYPTGIKVSAGEMAAIRLERSDVHGEWNYTILPHKRPQSKTGSERINGKFISRRFLYPGDAPTKGCLQPLPVCFVPVLLCCVCVLS